MYRYLPITFLPAWQTNAIITDSLNACECDRKSTREILYYMIFWRTYTTTGSQKRDDAKDRSR